MNIQLPKRLHLKSFDALYDRLHRLAANEALHVDMEDLEFAEPAGLLPLVCVLRNHVAAGGAVSIQSLPKSNDVCGYLERVNFYRLLSCGCGHKHGKRTNSDEFIEISEVGSHSLPGSTKTKLHSLFGTRVDVTGEAGDSFLTACAELVDNTRHAYNVAVEPQAVAWPTALILGQYYEQSNTLHVTVCDSGIGIMRSLGAKDPQIGFSSDKEAIDRALVLGMKAASHPGKGVGLAAITRFMSQNGGTLAIRSGLCSSIRTPYRRHKKVPFWKGTVVSLEIRGARSIDISEVIAKMAGKVR